MYRYFKGRRLPSQATGGVALGSLLLLAACQPTFNWREVRPAGAGLQAMMPCKPDLAERAVPLVEPPATLHMASCRTGDITFALAWTELPPAANVDLALDKWQLASRQALKASSDEKWSAPTSVVVSVAASRALVGQDHEARRTEARVLYAVHGQRLYQAATYGAVLSPEAIEPFFAGLVVQP